jgi:hypothetical protein
MVLALNDDRWSQLQSRSGSGQRVPKLLSRLGDFDDSRFCELLNELCDLNRLSVYSVAFAAVPHLVTFAETADPIARKWPLFVTAAVASFTKVSSEIEIPSFLEPDFVEATIAAQDICRKTIGEIQDGDYALFIQAIPVLNLATRPMFGIPLPGSFFLQGWFAAHGWGNKPK